MDVNQREKKIVETCKLILNDQIDFVVGCRVILALANDLNLPRDSILLPFVGFTSETDEYPDPDIRHRFSANYLAQIDEKVADYISKSRMGISLSCEILIKKFDQSQSR